MARRPQASQETAEEALNRAQLLVFDAWEARTARQRKALAEKALSISPLCADAYVLLAEHAEPQSDAELDLWQRAVEAGRNALGEETFIEDAGVFWGILETRPYMRARLGLAQALWDRGRNREAADHLKAMLHLNPNDNQGARYLLAAVLLEAGLDDELVPLLASYPDDDMADWSYARALAGFRTMGDTPESRQKLARALASNRHVPAYLTGIKPMPRAAPAYYSPGRVDEAICCALSFHKGWETTPGALDWLRTHAGATPTGRKPGRGRDKGGE